MSKTEKPDAQRCLQVRQSPPVAVVQWGGTASDLCAYSSAVAHHQLLFTPIAIPHRACVGGMLSVLDQSMSVSQW